MSSLGTPDVAPDDSGSRTNIQKITECGYEKTAKNIQQLIVSGLLYHVCHTVAHIEAAPLPN
jgi:hypothetical protein